MGYYMGDYRGDFYRGARGDPGIGSFFKGLASTVAGFIPGVGGLISKGIGAIPSRSTAIVKSFPGVGSIVKTGVGKAVGIAKAHPVLTAAGAAGTVSALAGAIGHHMGFKEARAAYLAGTGARPHRRMNVCNPRALRRAVRRAHGFAKLAMKTIHLVHPKKKVRFGGFRKRKGK